MIPKSLSASSLLVSEACMERWKHENFFRAPQIDSAPGQVGTTCHFALEHFVKAVYLDQTHDWSDVKLLNQFYDIGYMETFGSGDYDTPEYSDGAELVARWYDRNKMGLKDTVISCEIKENFPVKTSVGDIPFNFIWDRADQLDEVTYRVVDYKTLRKVVQPDDLKRKIQPRAYALAAQIKWPHAERIWITFDMLRYDEVGVAFSREENAATWRYLKRAAERIIAIDEKDTVETINEECKWCIKKATCDTLLRANASGSIMGLTVGQLAARKAEVKAALEALSYADSELDSMLVQEAEKRDELEFEEDGYEVKITSSKRRKVTNNNAIARIVGPVLAEKYGNFTVTSLDRMLKDEVLSQEIRDSLKQYIGINWGEPSAKVTPVNPLGLS